MKMLSGLKGTNAEGGKQMIRVIRAAGLALLFVALVSLLAGCVSKSEYESLLANYEDLVGTKADLEVELAEAQSDLNRAQNDYDGLSNEYETLIAEHDAVCAERDAITADYDTLCSDYETVAAELAGIEGIYPPKEFSSFNELEDWLLANDVSGKPITTTYWAWYQRALEVQIDALADGYIVSVDFDWYDEQGRYGVWCTAVINDEIWFWDPETDDIQFFGQF